MKSATKPRKCCHTKADGSRCRANATTGSDHCFFHDPAKAKERAAARKAGGEKGRAAVLSADSPDVPLQSVADTVSLISETINQVRRGEIDPKVSNAIGYLTGILLKALEQGAIEERISALETIVSSRRAA